MNRFVKLAANWRNLYEYITDNALMDTPVELLFVYPDKQNLEAGQYYVTSNKINSNSKVIALIRHCKELKVSEDFESENPILEEIKDKLQEMNVESLEGFTVYKPIVYSNDLITGVEYITYKDPGYAIKMFYCKRRQLRELIYTFTNSDAPSEIEKYLNNCTTLFVRQLAI